MYTQDREVETPRKEEWEDRQQVWGKPGITQKKGRIDQEKKQDNPPTTRVHQPKHKTLKTMGYGLKESSGKHLKNGTKFTIYMMTDIQSSNRGICKGTGKHTIYSQHNHTKNKQTG